MIGIVDYGAGNLRSVGNALSYLATPWSFVASPGDLARCARIILPGVGHFGPAMRRLAEAGLVEPLREAARHGTPLLGLCLGAQMLMEGSDESGDVPGLGLVPGRCVRLTTPTVPHMGWNRAEPSGQAALFASTPEYFYFAHSYVCVPDDANDIAATCECAGQRFCVAIERGRVFGVQFHPEKSAAAGLALLRRFASC